MVKYNAGLLICLMMNSTMFGGDPNANGKSQETSKNQELQKQTNELQAASVILKKNKGKNGVAVGASWEQLEVMQDTLDFIEDQFENRNGNENQ